MTKKIKGKDRMKITLELYGDDHKKLRASNPSPETVRATNIKVVVAEPGWQEIRHKLVGTWKDTPDENIKLLEDWLEDGSDPIRVRQVLNYLTGSGFRIGIITHPEIDRLRDKVRKIWASLLKDSVNFESYYNSSKT